MSLLPLGGNSAACRQAAHHKFVLQMQYALRNLLVPQKSPDAGVFEEGGGGASIPVQYFR
jgi:hypothetical protein